MEFKKKFTLDLKDYTLFNIYFNINQLVLFPILLVLVLPLLILLTSDPNNELLLLTFYLTWFLIAAVIAGLVTLVNIILLKGNSRKQFYASRVMQAENEITVNDTGVAEINEFTDTVMKWPDICSALESRRAFYIYFSKQHAFIIPKRYLVYGEDGVLRTLLKSNLAAEKLRLRRV